MDIAGYSPAQSAVQLLYGNGDGTFRAAKTTVLSATPTCISAADFNGDGISEILMGINGGNSFWVGTPDSEGTFRISSTVSHLNSSYSISIGDVNHDGISDFVSGTDNADTVHLHIGNGDGTFKDYITVVAAHSMENDVEVIGVADLNNDGAPDIMSGVASTSGFNEISIFLGISEETADIARPNLLTQENAGGEMTTLESVHERIISEMSAVGAARERLGIAASVMAVQRESYLAAESRIEDVDVAEEVGNLVRSQILQQACVAVLAQANMGPSIALSFLSDY